MSGRRRPNRRGHPRPRWRDGDLPALTPGWWFGWPSLIIDCVVVSLVLFPVTGAAIALAQLFPAESRDGVTLLLVAAGAAGYLLVPVALWGQTAGMKVMGVRLVRSGDLSVPGFRLAVVATRSRLRPVPGIAIVDDGAWRAWMRHSRPATDGR